MFALELVNIIFYNCVYISWYLRESEDGIDLCHINPSAMHLFMMRIMSESEGQNINPTLFYSCETKETKTTPPPPLLSCTV